MEGGVGSPEGGIDQDPWPGRTLAEQIEVESLIGVGAMGRVYLGHQRGVERAVAVKVLHPELMHNPAVLARFHREARIASRLNHPNVVQVLMSGEVTLEDALDSREAAPESGSSAAYLVMEYLDGASLAATLQGQREPMPLERALHIVLQVCDAVGEAHCQGIVHRDIKPENVMLVRRGSDPDFVKVLDFGVAKLDWLDGAQATQAGTVFGTARYISPEGACGEDVTPRSDVYSIATLLYQCLTGRTPFDGNNTVAVLVKQRAEAPPDLRSLAPGVPEPVAQVLHQNLAKAPGERAATARDFGAALLAAARLSSVDAAALADRPTLHGSRSVPPISSSRETVRRPMTLIDPELARIPAGGEQKPQHRPLTEIAPIPDLAAERDAIAQRAALAQSTSPAQNAPPARPVSIAQRASVIRGPSLIQSSSAQGSSVARGAFPTPASSLDFTPSPLEVAFDGNAPSQREPRRGRGGRKALWLGAFAVIGAVASLMVVQRLRPAASGLGTELERANSALAVGAWQTPDKQGFVDITDAALARYPDAQELTELRERGAVRLAREASKLEDVDPTRARELARLAVRLAPKNQEVARLTRSLLANDSNAPKIVPPTPEDVASAKTPSAPRGSPAMPEAPTKSREASPAAASPAAEARASMPADPQPGPVESEPVQSEPVQRPMLSARPEEHPEVAPETPAPEEPAAEAPPDDSGAEEPPKPGGRWL